MTWNLSLCMGNKNKYPFLWAFPGGSDNKESARKPRDLDSIPGSGTPGKGKVTYSSILAWRIP